MSAYMSEQVILLDRISEQLRVLIVTVQRLVELAEQEVAPRTLKVLVK